MRYLPETKIKIGNLAYAGRGGSFPPPVTVTWNPADKTANAVLSNANLTLGANASSDQGGRATLGRSTGKYYFEDTIGTLGGFAAIGISDALTNLASIFFGATSQAWAYWSNARVYNNGAFVAAPAFTTGDVLSVAVDLTGNKIWFARNGTYVSGNPSTGTSPSYSNLTPGTTYFPTGGTEDTSTTVNTANFGATAFSFAIPTGFTAWQGP